MKIKKVVGLTEQSLIFESSSSSTSMKFGALLQPSPSFPCGNSPTTSLIPKESKEANTTKPEKSDLKRNNNYEEREQFL